MKKNIYTFFILLIVSSRLFIYAQVGINTQNPQGVFHIHNTSNSSNDIVFTDDGFLGVGTVSPTAQLQIETTTAVSPLQIVDGNQQDSRVLMSDATGGANWGTMRGSGGNRLVLAEKTYTQASAQQLEFLNNSNTYTATGPGNYLLFLRMWGNVSQSIYNQAGFNMYLYRNGLLVDKTQFYAPATSGDLHATFSMIMAAPNTLQGDIFTIFLEPITGSFSTQFIENTHVNSTMTVFMM